MYFPVPEFQTIRTNIFRNRRGFEGTISRFLKIREAQGCQGGGPTFCFTFSINNSYELNLQQQPPSGMSIGYVSYQGRKCPIQFRVFSNFLKSANILKTKLQKG